jgi:hypothetical protein
VLTKTYGVAEQANVTFPNRDIDLRIVDQDPTTLAFFSKKKSSLKGQVILDSFLHLNSCDIIAEL